MREILFRGKRIDRLGNGEWVEGGIVHQTDFYGDPVDRYFIIDGTETEDEIGYAYRVDPETVGQYTGLTDKNGKKIFEGDIVRNHNSEVYEFAFIKQYSRFALRRPGTVFGWANPELCEIIGNIHDNPELLEV